MSEKEWKLAEIVLLRALLQERKTLPITIISESMVPLLPVGCRCTIAPVSYTEIKSFDLIVFFSEDKLVCHAVWAKQFLPAANGERTLLTRGFNNAGFDYPVRESEIVARVSSHQMSKWQRLLFVLKARFPILR